MDESAAAHGEKVRWGVLGVARIATQKVIPAMQKGTHTRVDAIASRDVARAREAAAALGIARAYGSYEDVLADPAIDAVYIPLPNHLHVSWSRKAAAAGKHVLCEKPIGLTAGEAEPLLDIARREGVLIQEAFMIRTHPQWLEALSIVRSGRMGPVRLVAGSFSYFNDDPANVRNVRAYGGGALLDIGCYLVNAARMMFEDEPRQVCALLERDPVFGVDRLSSMLLDFAEGHAVGTCATQLAPGQRVVIAGTAGRLEIEIPFNAPVDRPTRLFLEEQTTGGTSRETIEIPPCDQYTIQGDLLSRAIQAGGEAPYPLEDSIRNLRVLDALFESARTRAWHRGGHSSLG